jgi:ABC-type multidrug transport system permease subunit
VLFGRTAADALQQIAVLVVLSITGFIVGWRIENGFWNAALAYLLLLLFAYTVAWVGAWVGLHMPNPQTASTAGLIWLFPLTFLSNAFVPLAGMPAVVQTIAEWNPVSSLVLACRELFGNPPASSRTCRARPGRCSTPRPTPSSAASSSSRSSVLAVRKYRRTTG